MTRQGQQVFGPGGQAARSGAQAVLTALDAGAQQAGRQPTGRDRQLALMHGDVAVQP